MAAGEVDNGRIARNTVMLYVRMLITMVVGLYTSRVVLNTLGVDDFGIYGVVGGVVAMLSFVNASMSGATSRFITFEMGRGDAERLRRTFSSAVMVHVGITLLVLVLAETVGLWFVARKLVIPPERMVAAHWVYQLSIATAMLTITQVPYNAAIVAHERMDVYAYVEILRSVLLLAIVYVLQLGSADRLILYAWLYFAVVAVVMMIYRVYCVLHYEETHFHWRVDKGILKPMLLFSGWDLYGNACVAARQQGVNFVINMFFGVAYNAASTIATTVNGALSGLTMAVIQAFRPQIIKQYAAGNRERMSALMCDTARYAVLLIGLMAVPCILEMPYILELWLRTVPPSAVAFCRLLLVCTTFGLVNSIVNIGIHATGHIKLLSFLSGTIYLLTVPVVYVLFRMGMSVEWAYVVLVIAMAMILATNVGILRHLVSDFCAGRFVVVSLCSAAVVVASGVATWAVQRAMEPSFLRLVAVAAVNLLLTAAVAYGLLLNGDERKMLREKIMNKINHHA